jgi:hypothetical protein
MFRTLFLFACLLGLLASTDASAASTSAAPFPKGKIMPGDHRPIYRRYGHHGLFENGFFGMFKGNGKVRSKSGFTKSRRGTL